MNIKSQLSNVIKKKLFNTFIINEEVFSQMAEKEQLSENQEKYSIQILKMFNSLWRCRLIKKNWR